MPILGFNTEAPAYAGVTIPPRIEFAKHDWKYADIDFVFPGLPQSLQKIVQQVPLKGGYKRTLIDIKVQDLVPDITSCIPGWHLDGPENPLHDGTPETHHLFIHGGGPTEFIAQALMLRVTPEMTQRDLVSQIPKDVAVEPIPENGFNTFTRYDFHRGVNVKKPIQRLLIRVTETDIIRANNKPTRPAIGARAEHSSLS